MGGDIFYQAAERIDYLERRAEEVKSLNNSLRATAWKSVKEEKPELEIRYLFKRSKHDAPRVKIFLSDGFMKGKYDGTALWCEIPE